MLVAIAAVMGVLLVVLRRQEVKNSEFIIPSAVVVAIAYQSLLASMQLPSGFRGDLDRMEWMKTLPVQPMAIAAAQIGCAALLLSVVQAVMLLAAWGACGGA